jgi:CBS domain-containing protein
MPELLAKDLMTKNVIKVKADMTIRELSDILLKNKISGVPVVDDEDKLVGIVTEADIIKENIRVQLPFYFDPLMVTGYMIDFEKYYPNLTDYLNTKVEDIMNRRVKFASPETPLNEIADIMVYNKVNRVPIVDENKKIVGIITRADIIKTMIKK